MGWLLACLFSVLLWRTRRQLASLRRANSAPSVAESVQPAFASSQHPPLASRHLHNLVVLSLELSHLRQAGGLDSARYADLTAQIDTLWGDIVRYEGTVPQSQAWQEARAAAWELLCEQHSRWESPPWATGAVGHAFSILLYFTTSTGPVAAGKSSREPHSAQAPS